MQSTVGFDLQLSVLIRAADARDVFVMQATFQKLAAQGILLDSHYALTHPSEPNYIAAVGGDFFGLGNDALVNIPSKCVGSV